MPYDSTALTEIVETSSRIDVAFLILALIKFQRIESEEKFERVKPRGF